ncbi:proteobacterial dedicated sortase system histidine kinase [Alteromonas sp. ASW11-19]|uniref:histidine kinase n=1 Tax=Alteromonas salexigens TaxID=2982530 RepID=A0ABT2VN97_9ALTE|nr:proteobacterial dedicated sortase system histidine kinase [Alteromonas salexigens]MCU7554559.1 proteobacterial dedicated sortase system histidine kinase [Alteromonas salexigens]
MRVRFSIRLQLLLLSLFLFAIPWLGYKYVWELEQYLRTGQEQTMVGTARAVATALHERPALFDSQSSYLQTVRPGTDLYAAPIDAPVRLDGELTDWQQFTPLAQQYGDGQVVNWFQSTFPRPPVSLSFQHMVGRYGQYLYAMFAVTDDRVVWRGKNSLSIDRSDHLLIGLTTDSGKLQRFIIAPFDAGWVNAYRLDDDLSRYRAADNELRIQGRWVRTEDGYNIELRFPLEMTSGALAFAVVDVDDPASRTKQYAIGTANPNTSDGLGTVVTPSPEIERILAGLKYADSRVWVVDKHKRVLARAGDLQSSAGFRTRQRPASENSWWRWIEQTWLLPLYYHILTKPPAEFVDDMADAYALAGKDITAALNGEPDSLWRLTPDNKAVVLSAAYPIYIDDTVMGAVVVEQTTHGIRTLRNRALEELFHVILAVMLLGTAGLLLFANRISSRIRKLRDDTEAVIDDNGKIVGTLAPARQRDEIGDLSRAFADVLSRLQQYNSYLENMASRLSHELRTPIAVVKSSLDTLAQVDDRLEQAVFVQRAQTGISRLSTILNSMSEATRLEHAIAQEDIETFDVTKVLSGCVAGYQYAYANRPFQLKGAEEPMLIKGSPELFAQMLDKIVANATEFSNTQDSIVLNAWRDGKSAHVSVTNSGPTLPDGMKSQLLQSMVSVRPEGSRQQETAHPHLGLGLYIANMIAQFHKGSLTLNNLPDNTGVCVVITLPLSAP